MAFAENYFAIQESMNVSIVWMRLNCMHKSSSVSFPTVFLVLWRFFTWKTLESDIDFGSRRHFATCFPVLSRRTCRTLWRMTLVADVAMTNPLLQNFVGFQICHFFKREGWHRVVQDDDIGIRLPQCRSYVLRYRFQSVRESTSPTSFTS